MADPDEALIEAIAEALAAPHDNAKRAARAAYAATVAHLGLVEETRTLDDGVAGVTVGDASGLRQVWSIPNTVQRRLVSRWTGVS